MAASNTGGWMQATAVPFVIYRMTGRASWLGASALATSLPAGLLTPLAGHLADRYRRRQLLMVGQAIQLSVAVGLYAVWVTGWRQPGVLVGLVGIDGLAAGTQYAAWTAFTADVVEPGSLQSAYALGGVQYNLARVLGAGVAGLTLASLGPAPTFALNAVSFLPLLGALAVTRGRSAGAPGEAGTPLRMGAGWRAAAKAVRGDPVLRRALGLVWVMAAISLQLLVLAPVLVLHHLQGGARAYGLVVAAYAAGSATSAAVISTRPGVSRGGRLGVLVCASATATAALTHSVTVAAVAAAAAGGAYMVAVTPAGTRAQLRAPEALKGRVAALRQAAFTGGYPLVAAGATRMADAVGVLITLLVVAGVVASIGTPLAAATDAGAGAG